MCAKSTVKRPEQTETNFTSFSSVSIVESEQVNTSC